MTNGERIKRERKQAGLTQGELADKMGLATITIRQYELDKRNPSLKQLQSIATALRVPIGRLLTDEATLDLEKPVNDILSLFPDAVLIDDSDQLKKQTLLQAYDRLNPTGQTVAVERVEELTKIEDYTKK